MQEVWMEQNITGARMRSVSPRRHTWLFLCSYAPQRTFLQLPVALPCTESGNLWIVGLATWIYLTNPLFPHKHHLLFRPSLSFSFSQSSHKYKKSYMIFNHMLSQVINLKQGPHGPQCECHFISCFLFLGNWAGVMSVKVSEPSWGW